MGEPTSTTTGVVLAAVGFASIVPGIDGNAVIGAFAGAALLVVSSKELSIWQRLAYLVISLVAGYLAAPDIVRVTPIRSTGAAAFIAAALAITVTLQILERVKTADLFAFFKKGN